MAISGVGTFTAAYDQGGSMIVQTMPGGVRQDTTAPTPAAGAITVAYYHSDAVRSVTQTQIRD